MRRVLVVYWWPDHLQMRVAVEQHLRALDRGPDQVVYLNAFDRPPRWQRLESYDAVVLHTTFLCLRWDPAFSRDKGAWSWLANLDCPKIALPQDEYDHSAVLDEWLQELGVETVFSNFDEATRVPIYIRMRQARFSSALTGYIDRASAEYCAERAQPSGQRPYDIVYRALQLPFWFGSHGQLKHRIGLAVQERAAVHGLSTDISTRPQDTIFGQGWLDFVMSGRATIGAESGSSVLDPRGELQRRIRNLLDVDPALTFVDVDAQMPPGWDAYTFFAISPRHLEAVIARTCQVLVEGTYSGVLEPERHYIPIRRDLSDLDDALERLSDSALVDEITTRAYDEVYLNGKWTTDDFAAGLHAAFADYPPRSARRRFVLPAARAAEVTAVAAYQRLPTARPKFVPNISIVAHLVITALQSARRRPALARMLLRSLARGSWREVIRRDIARDLVRLGLLDRFERHQAAIGGPWRVRLESDESELRLVSVPTKSAVQFSSEPTELQVASIVWDHSRVGTSAQLDPRRTNVVLVSLGTAGRYEFAALSRLARAHPELPWAKLIVRGR